MGGTGEPAKETKTVWPESEKGNVRYGGKGSVEEVRN